MRRSRILGIALLVVTGVPGCAGVQSRTNWSSSSAETAGTETARRGLLARWWPRPSPTSSGGEALTPRVETARKAGPETEIWPTAPTTRLSRRFSLFGLRDRQASSNVTGANWPVGGQDALPRSPRVPGDREVRTASTTQLESRPHQRPEAGVVALGVEPIGLTEEERSADQVASAPDPTPRIPLEVAPRPDVAARPRLESQLIPAGIKAEVPDEPTGPDPTLPAQVEAQKPAAGGTQPPPPIERVAPTTPAQTPRTKPARPSTTTPQPGTRRPTRPAPAMEGQQTPAPARAARPPAPTATTPPAGPAPSITEPKPEPVPAPTPVPTQPAPATESEPRPAPPAAEPTPAPAPAPTASPAPAEAAPTPTAVAAPQVPTAQAVPAGPSIQGLAKVAPSPQTAAAGTHAPSSHRFSLLGWLHSWRHRSPEPEPTCSLPPVTFPTTYRLAMPTPQTSAAPAPAPAPAVVQPTAQAQPVPCPTCAPAKKCFSWLHKGILSGAIEKLKNCEKLKKLRLGCKCSCHQGGHGCKPCAAKGTGCLPTASPQANLGPVLPFPRVLSGVAQASDVAQGSEVLERLSAQGLDKAPQR